MIAQCTMSFIIIITVCFVQATEIVIHLAMGINVDDSNVEDVFTLQFESDRFPNGIVVVDVKVSLSVLQMTRGALLQMIRGARDVKLLTFLPETKNNLIQ